MEDIPENVIENYELKSKEEDGQVYVEIRKGMYGLPQVGILAQKLLEKRLKKKVYYQSMYTPGFWLREWLPIQFSLVVDYFGVKYVGEENAKHLVNTLSERAGGTLQTIPRLGQQNILRTYLGMVSRSEKSARIYSGICPRRAPAIQALTPLEETGPILSTHST